MGSLERLTLFNFKSYRDTVTAEFGGHYFVSIIGPNGAGKSNLMDAISFVLGLSLSELRGSHWDDMICLAGKNSSEARAGKEQTFVEIVYNSENEGQISFKRAIESGLNKTSYYINGELVDKGVYRESLKRHNILQQGRNFLVFQGDVENIASKSPSELADILETISGSARYRDSYNRINAAVERGRSSLTSLRDKRRELQKQIRDYSQRQQTGDELSRLIAQLNDLKREKYLTELSSVYDNKQSLDKRLVEIEQQISATGKELSNTEKEREKAQQLLAKEKRKLAALRHEDSQARSDIVRLTGEIAPLEKKIEIIKEQLDQVKPRKEAAAADVANMQLELDRILANLNISERARKELQERVQPVLKQFNQIPKRTNELYDRLDAKFTSDTAEDQSRLEHLRLDLRNREHRLRAEISEMDGYKNRLEELLVQERELESSMDECLSTLNLLKEKELEQKESLNDLSDEIRVASDTLEEQNSKLDQGSAKLKSLDDSKHASQKRLKLLDSVSKLKRFRPGVVDLLSSIVTPKEQKYQRSIDRALASHFDSIVVDSFNTVKDCIDHAKELGMGPLTFLPLDTLRVDPIDTSLRTLHPQAKLALDCVNYNERYKLAVGFALGDKILCETSEIAGELRWTRKISKTFISLDGTVFSKGNVIEGGISQASDRYDEKRVLQLQRQMKTMIEKIHGLTESLVELREREEAAVKQVNHTRASIEGQQRLKGDLEHHTESLGKEKEYLNSKIEELEPEVNELLQSVQNTSDEIQQIETQLDAKREIALAPFIEQIPMSLVEYESSKSQMEKERSSLDRELQKLQEAEAFARTRLDDANKRLRKLEGQEARLNVLIHDASHIEQLQGELEEATEMRQRLAEKLVEATARVEAAAGQLDRYAVQASEQDGGSTRLNDELADIREELEKLSRREDSVMNSAANNGMVFTKDEADALKKEAWEAVHRADEDVDMLTRGADYASTLARLNNEILHLQELVDAQAGRRTTDTHLEKAEAEEKQLEADIEAQASLLAETESELQEIRTQRLEAFEPAFNLIKDSIDEIYKELTTNDIHPFGGSASLDASNLAEPYLDGIKFTVMPPTKRYKDIDQLSGGEKTVAALALLFSIQRFRPSPFFVLDEIDAALDPANIRLVASYIRKHMGPGFQFIVISLKLLFFENADGLVGVHRQKGHEGSRLLMVDL